MANRYWTFCCDSCGAKFKISDQHLGRSTRCPQPTCDQSVSLKKEDAIEVSIKKSDGRVLSKQLHPVQQPVSNQPVIKRGVPTKRPSSKRTLSLFVSTVVAVAICGFGFSWLSSESKLNAESNSPSSSSAELPKVRAVESAYEESATQEAFVLNGEEAQLVAQRSVVQRNESVFRTVSLKKQANENTSVAAAKPQPALQDRVPLQPIPDIDYAKQIGSFLTKYCIDCHGPDAQEGGLELHQFDSIESMRKQRKTWKHLSQLVEISAMPPVDADPLPEKKEIEQFTQLVDLALNYVDCSKTIDPGRVTVRRLNRNEYNNTIRDLVGLDLKPADNFPTDDVGEGFDNIGDVLTLSPILFEKYIEAAEEISEAAILDGLANGKQAEHWNKKELKGTGSAKLTGRGDWSINSLGSVTVDFDCYQDDDFQFIVRAEASQAGPELAKLQILVDGKPFETIEIKGNHRPDFYSLTIPLLTGHHQIAAVFINDYWNPKAKDPKLKGDRNARVESFQLIGNHPIPYEAMPAHHRDLVFCRPDEVSTARECAHKILEKFATRAFRRPVRPDELQKLVQLAVDSIDSGNSFEAGIQLGVQAILVSPQFLFRLEIDRNPHDATLARKIDDYELASRLSYFIWSSTPDDELMSLASKNRLHYQTVLENQIHRMLQDEKADALVENFGGQWLNLRNLYEITPKRKVFTVFNEKLRNDMRRETELFFAHIMREDMSIMDLITADFTFVNRRLASLYGLKVEGLSNNEFKYVSLKEEPRRGILTHASILMLTSNPTRTAPVKRGKWVMENILGEEPPPPPPNVPPLEELKEAPKNATLREKFALHRADPGCASCHQQLDPLGFGLENFNVIGQWRTQDGKFPVDASGTLPSGESFDGAVELISILGQREESFRELFAQKMLTFALGRGLGVYDQCAIEEITTQLKNNKNRFSELVIGIVNSEPFQKRRGETAAPLK